MGRERPRSRPAKRDGRTRDAKLLKSIRAELTAHLGGNPSATQRALIEQVGQIRLRLTAMDAKFAATGEQSLHDSRSYLAHANSVARIMSRLGLKGVAERPLTLNDHLAKRHGPVVVA